MKKKCFYIVLTVLAIVLLSIIYTQFQYRDLAPGNDFKDEVPQRFAISFNIESFK